jgi:hypothetical protein
LILVKARILIKKTRQPLVHEWVIILNQLVNFIFLRGVSINAELLIFESQLTHLLCLL